LLCKKSSILFLSLLLKVFKIFSFIEGVKNEPINGAHRDKDGAAKALANYFISELAELEKLDINELVAKRIDKVLSIGAYEE